MLLKSLSIDTSMPKVGAKRNSGVSGVDFSRFTPGDLVVTYRDEDVYLFDAHAPGQHSTVCHIFFFLSAHAML
jgi:hypothetical protein